MKASPQVLPEIFVYNRQRKVTVDRAALQEFSRRVLPLCAAQSGSGLTSLEQIDVVLISACRIAQLHQRFMQIPGPTDVITFQHGEIFISVETARRQARALRSSFVRELQLYLVHGLLHLQGFTDKAPAARARMQATQEKIFALLEMQVGKTRRPALL